MGKHCKGCVRLSAKRKDNIKYVDWCCEMGNAASKVIGHCKLKGLKKTGESK